MTSICISCPDELWARHAASVEHFKNIGLDVKFVNAIHGETFGILSWRPYRLDRPAAGQLISMAHTGLCLSHYMVWTACQLMGGNEFLILEDDAVFVDGWMDNLTEALEDLPEDWDILLIGSSNTEDKPKRHIAGTIYEVKYPFCTHAYMVNSKSVAKLFLLCRDASMNIDICMMTKAYPALRVYTVLPRIVSQRDMDLLV